jgi:hypothetical protein
MKISHSSKLYLERKGVYLTQRIGGPRLDIGANAVHTIPLEIPNPSTCVARKAQITQPDAGHTSLWPRGEATF